MTRQQFIDGLRELLDKQFPDEQGGFQLSEDDLADTQNQVNEYCHNVVIEE